jgi:hypothetical protein
MYDREQNHNQNQNQNHHEGGGPEKVTSASSSSSSSLSSSSKDVVPMDEGDEPEGLEIEEDNGDNGEDEVLDRNAEQILLMSKKTKENK